MASNPDPQRITDEMWRLWEDRPNKNWKLGGIFANKAGYHNTVKANQSFWPRNYSVKLPLDLNYGNHDKARAIDLTMSESEMKLWTSRMKDSALDPEDHRLAAVKEFYGTLDGKTVYGLSKDTEHGKWERSSADITHIWHGHASMFAAFVNNWLRLAPILSVWKGETNHDWLDSVAKIELPVFGDSGEEVKYWQYVHNQVRNIFNPAPPVLVIDGDYGKATAAAFADFWEKSRGPNNKEQSDGKKMTGWLAFRYQRALAFVSAPPDVVVPPVQLPDEKLVQLVNDWLNKNIPSNLTITGKVQL